MRVDSERFEKAVVEAIDSIPDVFQEYLANVQFIIEEKSADHLMGLYEGATALDAGDGLPERITIYRREHERCCRSWPELVEEVRRTILHEVGHHFGMEESELPW